MREILKTLVTIARHGTPGIARLSSSDTAEKCADSYGYLLYAKDQSHYAYWAPVFCYRDYIGDTLELEMHIL